MESQRVERGRQVTMPRFEKKNHNRVEPKTAKKVKPKKVKEPLPEMPRIISEPVKVITEPMVITTTSINTTANATSGFISIISEKQPEEMLEDNTGEVPPQQETADPKPSKRRVRVKRSNKNK
jgi:hypothetical protein